MTAAEVAERFHSRQVRPGEWRARCPHHRGGSKTSLSIREAPDGRILLHCFGGCGSSDVLAAIGLKWRDVLTGPGEPRPENSLDPQTRAAVARAKEMFRCHPAASRTENPLTVVVTNPESMDATIGRALALAASGELVQAVLEDADASRKD